MGDVDSSPLPSPIYKKNRIFEKKNNDIFSQTRDSSKSEQLLIKNLDTVKNNLWYNQHREK